MQTRAVAKTNKETVELTLLIATAQTSPLLKLNWTQELKTTPNSITMHFKTTT